MMRSNNGEDNMALSAPQPGRKPLHTRTIEMNAFHREDGLWDIEGEVIDQKAYAYSSPTRGDVEPGDKVHDMFIRMTLDNSFTVVAMEVSMDVFPFPICNEVEPNFQNLVGLRVGPGWMKRVREQVGGKNGCTHVVELFGPMATVAFQSIPSYSRILNKDKPPKPVDPNKKPRKPFNIGGCYSWAYDSPIVKELMPEWYRED